MISEEAKSSVASFELLSGYRKDDGTLLRKVTISEMTGVEEDIITSSGKTLFDKLQEIMSNCVIDFDGVKDKGVISTMVLSLPVADRSQLLVEIRKVSCGSLYRFQVECPNCKQKQWKQIDLDTLERHPAKDPGRRVYEVKTPRGRLVEMKVMTGVEQKEAAEKSAKMKTEVATLAMELRVSKIDGKKPGHDELRALPSSERNFIRDQWRGTEAEFETDVEATCVSCQHEFEIEVSPSEPSFFFPSATSKP
jgi:hypothetical protein